LFWRQSVRITSFLHSFHFPQGRGNACEHVPFGGLETEIGFRFIHLWYKHLWYKRLVCPCRDLWISEQAKNMEYV
jgi:hypothetical protein